MKKIVIKTALKLTPMSLQNKAICRALNYLIQVSECPFEKGIVVKINVHDLKQHWLVELREDGFFPSKEMFEDLEIRSDFDTLMACSNKQNIPSMLNNGSILILGSNDAVAQAESLLDSIEQNKLDKITEGFWSFFKVKYNEGPQVNLNQREFDIDSMTISDIKTQNDVEFLRDAAIRLEEEDLEKAIKLMGLAHQARPQGPLIKRKLDEYLAKQNSNGSTL